MPNRPYTFDRVSRIVFSLATVVAVLYVLNILRGVLLPFLVACLIAYLLEPLVKWNMRWTHLKGRFIPVVLTLLEACVVFGGFLAITVPYLVSEFDQMGQLIKDYAASNIHIPYISDQIHAYIRENVDWEKLSRLVSKDQVVDLLKNAVASSWNFVSSSLAFIFAAASWLIVVLYVIFIMLDFERLMLSFRQLVPLGHRRKVFHIVHDIETAMNRYFRGQFFIAMIVGVLFAIGFAIVGLPLGVALGLLVGVLNLVPYLQLLSLPVATVLCLVAAAGGTVGFWPVFWQTMSVYVVVQCIQDLILTPKIMGSAMGLNPAIILLSLSIWGSLLGFMGLIIGLPLTTLVLSYYNLYVIQRSEGGEGSDGGAGSEGLEAD